jgi:nucleoid-associated protein YgaU
VANATGQVTVLSGEEYVVAAGDSLWSIAVAHYGDSVAPRSAVESIRHANRLAPGHILQPGETLLLPGDTPWGAGVGE